MKLYEGIEELKHIVLCPPGSGAGYFSSVLNAEGHPCSHEQVKCHIDVEGQLLEVSNDMQTPPRTHVSHVFTSRYNYELAPFGHCDKWVLVRDPLRVILSCMVHSNIGIESAIRDLVEFYSQVGGTHTEGYIYVDRPNTWFEFNSSKDYPSIARTTNPHNAGLLEANPSRLRMFSRTRPHVRRLLELREQLGYK